MSRKSKRRRLRLQRENGPPGHDAAESFEFLDDRAGAPDAPRLATPAPAAKVEPVPPASPVSSASGIEPAPERLAAVEPVPPEPALPDAAPAAPIRTLGEILTEAREASGLSVEEASARTRIAAKMLRHLEDDQFGEFAAEAYARGALRAYGGFLGLDAGVLLQRYEAMRGHSAEPAPQPVWEPVVEPAEVPAATVAARARVGRRWLVSSVVALVGLAIAAGVYWVQRGGVQLRPEAGLTQIENELRDTHSEASHKDSSPAPVVVDSTPADLEPRAVVRRSPPAEEDTAPTPVAKQAVVPAPVAPSLLAAREAVAPTRASAPEKRPSPLPPRQPSAPITDLVEEKVPANDLAAARKLDPLVLTAAARDTCSLRLQIDTADGRTLQVHLQPGEARSWTASESFRIAARRGSKVDLWLNGRPVTIPGDGRPLRIDRGSAQASPSDTPGRSSGGRAGRKNRQSSVQSPASASMPSRTHGPGPHP